MYSFETGNEVTLRGGKRLSGLARGDDNRGGSATVTAVAVAADVTSDNRTLAVACSGSGKILSMYNASTAITQVVFIAVLIDVD